MYYRSYDKITVKFMDRMILVSNATSNNRTLASFVELSENIAVFVYKISIFQQTGLLERRDYLTSLPKWVGITRVGNDNEEGRHWSKYGGRRLIHGSTIVLHLPWRTNIYGSNATLRVKTEESIIQKVGNYEIERPTYT